MFEELYYLATVVVFFIVAFFVCKFAWSIWVSLTTLSKTPLAKAYDYIIVGGGTAGCVLANRLSASGDAQVLVVEAGHDDNETFLSKVRIPIFTWHLMRMGTDWGFETPPQPGLADREITMSAGKILGGTSCISWMTYMRPNKADFDKWEEMGCKGWDHKTAVHYFKKSECSFLAERSEYHDQDNTSSTGPVPVTLALPPNPLAMYWAFTGDNVGIKRNLDYNGPSQEGCALTQVNVFMNGSRASSNACFIPPSVLRKRKNLHVKTEANVTSVAFEGKKAVGIILKDNKGKEHIIVARKEVILCAGAVGTPKLLMRSGIGPEEHLQQLDIPVLYKSPGVGSNLCDGLMYPLFVQTRRALTYDPRNVWKMKDVVRYFMKGSGPMRTNFLESLAFIKTNKGRKKPDVLLQFSCAGGFDPTFFYGLDVPKHIRRYREAVVIFVTLLNPPTPSTGSVRLSGTASSDKPIVDPAYRLDETSLRAFVSAIRTAVKMVTTTEPENRFKTLVSGANSVPQVCWDEEDPLSATWREHLEKSVLPSQMMVGTCSMCPVGPNEAVVDPETLKVNGVDQLRVADCSIIPSVASGGTNATAMMIGERAADNVLGVAKPNKKKK